MGRIPYDLSTWSDKEIQQSIELIDRDISAQEKSIRESRDDLYNLQREREMRKVKKESNASTKRS